MDFFHRVCSHFFKRGLIFYYDLLFRVPPYSSGPLPTPQQPPSLGLPSTPAPPPLSSNHAHSSAVGAHFYGGGASHTQTRPHSTIFSSSTLPSPRRRAAEKARREAEAAAVGGGANSISAVSLEGAKAELRTGQDGGGAKPQNVSERISYKL